MNIFLSLALKNLRPRAMESEDDDPLLVESEGGEKEAVNDARPKRESIPYIISDDRRPNTDPSCFLRPNVTLIFALQSCSKLVDHVSHGLLLR